MLSSPPPLPLLGRTNERYELVGEGFSDARGNPTRNGLWYQLVDFESTGEYGVIVGGPFSIPPSAEPAELDTQDEKLFLAAIADAIGRAGHANAGTIASALATQMQVAAHHGRTGLADRLHDLVRDVMGRALYHDRHPAPPSSFRLIELASERV